MNASWPVEYGGGGRSISYEFLVWDCLAYYRGARPDIGAGMIARTIINHGTDAQKERFLPPLGRGSLSCALGYSEPEAGSDLTHLRTRARRDGDRYVVKGHKIWTSDAHHADRLWLLCRTHETQTGARGLSILFMDLRSAGVRITPIPTMDGHQVNEVFLDDVIVPEGDRIGSEGEAWTLIREALAVERHTQVLPGRLRGDLETLEAAICAVGLDTAPRAQTILMQLWARYAAVEASSLATVAEMVAGGAAVARAARAKLLGSELCQTIPRAGIDLLGLDAVMDDSDLAFLWRQSTLETIAGGTVEIMLSLLAKETLGLRSNT